MDDRDVPRPGRPAATLSERTSTAVESAIVGELGAATDPGHVPGAQVRAVSSGATDPSGSSECRTRSRPRGAPGGRSPRPWPSGRGRSGPTAEHQVARHYHRPALVALGKQRETAPRLRPGSAARSPDHRAKLPRRGRASRGRGAGRGRVSRRAGPAPGRRPGCTARRGRPRPPRARRRTACGSCRRPAGRTPARWSPSRGTPRWPASRVAARLAPGTVQSIVS